MSSLGAAQADGYYHPPDYDPRKHGGLNKYQNSHALGKRARKLKTEGILVVRFETPFDLSCTSCGKTIGKGVRFNAEKKQVGNYYSTKVWSFRMKTPCCKSSLEIRTDPKNTDYQVFSGATRKRSSELALDDGTGENHFVDLLSEDERQARQVVDPFEQLEKSKEQKEAVSSEGERIQGLLDRNSLDNYQMNRKLRGENRTLRKQEKALAREGKALGLSDDIKLLAEKSEDGLHASLAMLQRRRRKENEIERTSASSRRSSKRRAIRKQSIFAAAASSSKGKNTARATSSHNQRANSNKKTKKKDAKRQRLLSRLDLGSPLSKA
jgi:coiled-coil domain-containing protein 130